MAINTYKKSADTKLSANFRSAEFDCKGSGCCSTTQIDSLLVDYLQKIREHFGAAVTISSGYRCEKHNAKVANAASKSRHISGTAADIQVKGIAPAAVAKYAESIGVLGIGLYDTFVHIDTRTSKSFWYGHAQEKRQSFGGAPAKTVQVQAQVLRKGDSGASVKVLQTLLGVNADGIFGAVTDNALRSFQKAAGLTADGICGEISWNALLGVQA